jgi:AraC-like DNA-binding protein
MHLNDKLPFLAMRIPFLSKDPVRSPFRRNAGPFFLPFLAGCDVKEDAVHEHLFHDFTVDAVEPMISVIISFRGSAKLELAVEDRSLVAGSVLLVTQPSPTRILLTRTGCPWGFVYFNFRDPWPMDSLKWLQQRVGPHGRRLDLGKPAGRKFVVESSRLAGDLRKADAGSEMAWSLRCYSWFLDLLRALGVEADVRADADGRLPSRAEMKTLAGSCRTIKEFARQMNYSPGYLSRKLKASWRRAPGATLREARLDQARQALANSDLGVAEIAHRFGYGSVSSFIRAFRLHFGTTPAKARRRI